MIKCVFIVDFMYLEVNKNCYLRTAFCLCKVATDEIIGNLIKFTLFDIK